MYTYCGNDPINHTDPDGLFFKALGKALWGAVKRIIHAAVKAAIQALPALFTGGPQAFLVAFAGAFVANLGFPKMGNFLTPGWNPGASHPLNRGGSLGGLNSSLVIRNFIGISQNIAQSRILPVASAISNFLARDTKPGPKTRKWCSQIEPYINASRSFFESAWSASNYGATNADGTTAAAEQGGLGAFINGYMQGISFPRNPNTFPTQMGEDFYPWAVNTINNFASGSIKFWYHTHPFDTGVKYTFPGGVWGRALDQNFPTKGDRNTSRALNLIGIAITPNSIIVFDERGRRCRFNR